MTSVLPVGHGYRSGPCEGRVYARARQVDGGRGQRILEKIPMAVVADQHPVTGNVFFRYSCLHIIITLVGDGFW